MPSYMDDTVVSLSIDTIVNVLISCKKTTPNCRGSPGALKTCYSPAFQLIFSLTNPVPDIWSSSKTLRAA